MKHARFQYVAREVGGFTYELAEATWEQLDVASNGFISEEQFAAIVDEYVTSEPDSADVNAC